MSRPCLVACALLLWNGLVLAQDTSPSESSSTATELSPPAFLRRILVSPLADNAQIGDATLDAWTGTLASELARAGHYQVMTPRDLRTLVEAEELAQLLGCMEERCVANLGRASGADYIVSGQVGQLDEARVMTLALLDSANGAALSRVTRALPVSDIVLALERAADELLARAQNEPLAELTVVSEPSGAFILVDGRAFGTTPLPATALRPGEHVVVVQAEGHRLAEETVTLTPQKLSRLRVTLAPIEEQMKLADVAQVAEDAAKAGALEAKRETDASLEREREEAMRRDAALRETIEVNERSTRDELESTRQSALVALERSEKLAEEAEARRQEEEKASRRKRLGGISVLVAYPFFNDTVTTSRRTLTHERPPLVIGLNAKIPLFWKLYLSLKAQALPPFPETLGAPAGTTPESYSSEPLSLLEMTAGIGLHIPIAGPLFFEADATAGPRGTIYVRDVQASSGAMYREAPWSVNGVFAGRAAFGVGFGIFEISLSGRVSVPFADEPPLPFLNASPSLGGFGTFAQMGLEAGLSF